MGKRKLEVGLVGNPNCGKTTLFNALTGARQQVGNWPGVTVEKKIGFFSFNQTDIELVDLPGTYSLDYFADSTSLDEQVAQKYILSRSADLIINIIDASNLERNLYLTTQLLEMQVPMIVVLNMMDAAKSKGIEIDIEQLSTLLDCSVIPVIASKNQGVGKLKEFLDSTEQFSIPHTLPEYPPLLTSAVEAMQQKLSSLDVHQLNSHWLALKLIEGDASAMQLVDAEQVNVASSVKEDLEAELDEELDIITADARYSFIGRITKATIKRKDQLSRTTSDKIDSIVLNRVLGIPIFLVVMYLMFMFAINLGTAFTDFFDGFFGAIFVDGFNHVLSGIGAPDWVKVIFADGLGGGIQTVSTFIPVITFLFLFLSILEDSGYMARAAFVMDKFMRFIGLPGKSFVPLIVGFGCNVPAVMATRTLETERDRLMTMAMAPFMSCGARLPVYALFAAAFFPVGGQNIVFLLYLIGIGAAILTGLALKKTLLPGESTPFIMELPTYHLPSVKGVAISIWGRLKSFIFRAGSVIVPMVMVLNLLNSIGVDGSFGHQDTKESVLSSIGKNIAPVFSPMGMTQDNWPAAVGIFTGVLAKEAVVGTLNALYEEAASSSKEATDKEDTFDFWGEIRASFQTIPDNIKALSHKLIDPLGLSIAENGETENVSQTVFGSMKELFPNTAAAFAYLLLILLYFPCVAVIGAVTREANLRWAVFIGLWCTGLGYSVSVIFYQLAIFTVSPIHSISWIVGLVIFIVAGLLIMKRYAAKKLQKLTVKVLAQE
ncbi:Fe(2+) transporter permease subunit FeoB [Entomomonas moraniae]|uniref:Ferrous iron transport protein B n=1 Tax=Entomomonas moraniae TaxID=2213226 RepID=A0A3Q9JLB7_9GAMM|nr:Fe(2+) transporter permease subunit FeoB [Entomomonas moraniae]AZS51968.1 Fe(2+) transporter permease subunit FeoB [Entomomonas moraniae]